MRTTGAVERASAQAAGPPEGSQEVWAEARAAGFSKAPGFCWQPWLGGSAVGLLPSSPSWTRSRADGEELSATSVIRSQGARQQAPPAQPTPASCCAGSGSLLAHHWKGS